MSPHWWLYMRRKGKGTSNGGSDNECSVLYSTSSCCTAQHVSLRNCILLYSLALYYTCACCTVKLVHYGTIATAGDPVCWQCWGKCRTLSFFTVQETLNFFKTIQCTVHDTLWCTVPIELYSKCHSVRYSPSCTIQDMLYCTVQYMSSCTVQTQLYYTVHVIIYCSVPGELYSTWYTILYSPSCSLSFSSLQNSEAPKGVLDLHMLSPTNL